MQLFILVLNKLGCLKKILSRFAVEGIPGATILESSGMVQFLCHDTVEPPAMFGSLRELMNPVGERNKTILVLMPEDKIAVARRIVNEETGGLDKPNVGLIMVLPVASYEGGHN